MTVLIAIAAISLWSIIATIEVVVRDGYRPVPFDPMYDPRWAGYASPGARYR